VTVKNLTLSTLQSPIIKGRDSGTAADAEAGSQKGCKAKKAKQSKDV